MRRNATACPKPERSEDHLDRPESNSDEDRGARNRMTRAEDFESFAGPKFRDEYVTAGIRNPNSEIRNKRGANIEGKSLYIPHVRLMSAILWSIF